MTNKRAIEIIQIAMAEVEWDYPMEYTVAFEKAIEILEKQEPKRVKDYHHCPNCGEGLPAKGITNKWCECCYEWNYCPECGQALKWK